jgi:hypothetical protein
LIGIQLDEGGSFVLAVDPDSGIFTHRPWPMKIDFAKLHSINSVR